MNFDTYEAFFRAVYKHAGIAPVSVHDEFEHIMNRAIRSGNRPLIDDLSAATRAATGLFVKLMRSCFYVHETATSHKSPGDDLLGYRLEQACDSLAEGYQLVIQVSNGQITLALYDNRDRQVNFPSLRESLSGQVTDAVLFAERPPERRKRPGHQHVEDPDHGDNL